MEKLTAMTLGAIALGSAGFAYDAVSGPRAEPVVATARIEFVEPRKLPDDCTSRQAAVYFEQGSARVSASSKAVLERIAAEAKACGKSAKLVAEAPQDDLERRRAEALEAMFVNKGVKAQVRTPAVTTVAASGVEARAASVQLVVDEEI